MTTPKKYNVRFSNIDDHEKIMEFYTDNAHKNVLSRDEELVKKLADHGSIILIEEADTGNFVGASISYPINVKDGDVEQQKWLEVGTTRIVLNGYPGLFDAMIAMQVLRAYLVEPPTEQFVCRILSPNVQSLVKKQGWRTFVPPDELVETRNKMFGPGSVNASGGTDSWFSAGPEALPLMAALLRDILDKGSLKHAKNDDTIQLDFSKSKFFRLFEEEFRNLADKNYGDPDKPDPTKSIAKHRQEWMRWYFK